MNGNERKLPGQFSRMLTLMHLNEKESMPPESHQKTSAEGSLVTRLLRADPTLTDEEHAYLLEMYTSFIGSEPVELEYLDSMGDSHPSNEDFRLGVKLISGSGKIPEQYI